MYKLLARISLNELYHVFMSGIGVNLKRLDRGERMTSQESVVVKNVDKNVDKSVGKNVENRKGDDRMKSAVKSQNWAKTGRSVLNGIIGDYLEKENSPLAIKMGFYHRGRKLDLNESLASQFDSPLTNKVVLLVHGLTNLETVWDFPSNSLIRDDESSEPQNYGTKLQQDFSYTPIYLRYNTGLPVERNAEELSNLLANLMKVFPVEIEELTLIGFSMGGLLCRDAQRFALMESALWLQALSKVFYIGSPHEGAPLEKIGYFAGEVFRQLPKEYLSHWADVIDVRSEGIKDLKHGLKKREGSPNESPCESFVSSARHYFISGGVFDDSYSFLNKLVGDSLVRKSSAKPSSAPKDSASAHFNGLAHIPLAHSELVYQQIREWIERDEDDHTIDLIRLEPNAESCRVSNSTDFSNSELISGTIDLLVSGFNGAVKTVETMHYSIAEESFAKTNRLPVISQFSFPVEKIHKGVSDSVFSSLRYGGRLIHKVAKSSVAKAEKKQVVNK